MGAPLWTGLFDVEVDAEAVDEFSRAVGYAGQGVPPGFPMRWLGRAYIKTALAAAVQHYRAEPGILVHVGQDIAYERPLAVGQRCRLTLELHQGQSNRVFTVAARFADAFGVVGRMSGQFRIADAKDGI